MATAASLLTAEELLALPGDGIFRELIRGELREYPMTTRGGPHCLVSSNLDFLIGYWLRQRAHPRGRLYSGEMRVRIRREPDTFVGVDLVYISPEMAARIPSETTFLDEPPTLVIEVLSPSDVQQDILDKVREYLDAGVPLVWVIEPVFRPVTIYRPGAEPEFFNVRQELTAEPHLPGFRIPVAEIFVG